MKEYLVCLGNGRGKNYYFDNVEDAIKKAKEMQKRCITNVLLIKGVLENGKYRHCVENKIKF